MSSICLEASFLTMVVSQFVNSLIEQVGKLMVLQPLFGCNHHVGRALAYEPFKDQVVSQL